MDWKNARKREGAHKLEKRLGKGKELMGWNTRRR